MEKWNQAETITTWIIITLLIVVFLVILIIKLIHIGFKRQIENQQKENQIRLDYQKKLIETSIIIQERERDRIASDLHDSLIGKLTTLRLKKQIGYDADDLDLSLQDCIAEARRISHDLTPPMLEYIEIDELIENTIASWNNCLTITFYKHVVPISCESDFKLQIIRIIQELLMNIHKHAETLFVMVHLRISTRKVIIMVKDKGKGFDNNKDIKGLGLRNIELRVMYLNGLYKVKSGVNGTASIFLFNL